MISFLNQRVLLRSAIASLSLIFITFSATASPQQQNDFGTSIQGPKVLLMASDVNENTTVPAPPILPQAERLVNITVNYNGFTNDAQTAFQAAVDIWESILVGNQTINITANWTPLAANILGSAGAAFIHWDFTGAPMQTTAYPTPLANELCGCDQTPGAADINANFNSNFANWYLGTDGATPAGQYDFMSVVLHEIGHGLGFAGSANVDGAGEGSLFFPPNVYDLFVEDLGVSNVTGYFNPSLDLGNVLQGSGNLVWNGANAVAGNGGAKPELFDPNPWTPGSSYSHFAESYFLAGDVNSLMTPSIGTAEAIHDPGPACLGLLEDLGWGINYEGCIEGACTDPFACNYHPDACDTGSCIYCPENCVSLTLMDSYGDGWNGASWEFLDEMGVSWANGTLASGSEFTEIFCLNSGCYNFAVTTGSWPAEVSWELVGANGGVITGGASESMSVSFGDVEGCTNPIACNYDSDACIDDGTCAVDDECGVCGGSGIPAGDCDCDGNQLDECGDCGGSGIPAGDCDCDGNLPADGYDCDGNCLVDTDGDGTCDEFEIDGCTDSEACNYDAAATEDDGTCYYLELTDLPGGAPACGLFFSGYAEGSSNHKFLEIYNPTDADISLDGYAYPSVANAPTTPGVHEYWNEFDEGAVVAAGDVYIIAHGSADPAILAEADEFHTYLSNGDDGYALVQGDESSYVIVDMIGTFDADPGSGWEVAGVENGTKDHSLIRKSDVNSGNGGDWATSAGTNADDSEWLVLDQNDWTGLGSHEFTGSCGSVEEAVVYDCDGECLNDSDGDGVCDELEVNGCTTDIACNYDPNSTEDDGSCDFISCITFGCTLEDACNYDPDAGYDDGSCDYSCYAGCTDSDACNYDPDAWDDDGTCEYVDECGICGGSGIAEGACDCDGNQLDALGVCGGDCPYDFNGNGTCDDQDIYGCTYSYASNYNADATSDDGSCDYEDCDPYAGYDAGYDDGWDHGYYDGVASVECPDGSSSCPSDLDNDGAVATTDLLIFLSAFGDTCDE